MSATKHDGAVLEHDEAWEQYDAYEEDTICPNCGGTGGEPYDDYITPCEDCDGEGYKWWL